MADLEAIRRQIGADQIVLFGVSWGASLASNYLAAHPELLAGWRTAKRLPDRSGGRGAAAALPTEGTPQANVA